ncbi:transcription initiation factor TFIID subunit 8-like isoform X2 [Salvelinus fontinalis]|uniref:transcription initiation factor TFIID subunit 8-like isoform X2 n=1 Tax=Salvelinus fontinalis TaxID=8038 RepID=UPI00248671EE|nr:transcription initiation factor TFIID subunit 8-like isoform X2 [Salvelinus fontinalis]
MADPAVMAGGFSAVVGRSGGGKATSSPAENYQLARRRTLQVVVSSLLTECGFESAEKAAVESLTEMIQSLGRCAKAYCEHTARITPTLSDTVVTLIEMGFNVNTLPVYAKRSQRMVITARRTRHSPNTRQGRHPRYLQEEATQVQRTKSRMPREDPEKALIAGQKRTHPSHIPSHFPEFPDPHTYIKTPTFREPVSDYQVVREKAASQRRDVERALTRFMAKTGETQSLFKDDITAFPLIAARPSSIPYLSALLPSELELQTLEETDSSEQDDQTDSENTPGNNLNDDPGADKENSMLPPGGVVPSVKASEENMIDNPYLRPVKKPKVRRKK